MNEWESKRISWNEESNSDESEFFFQASSCAVSYSYSSPWCGQARTPVFKIATSHDLISWSDAQPLLTLAQARLPCPHEHHHVVQAFRIRVGQKKQVAPVPAPRSHCQHSASPLVSPQYQRHSYLLFRSSLCVCLCLDSCVLHLCCSASVGVVERECKRVFDARRLLGRRRRTSVAL